MLWSGWLIPEIDFSLVKAGSDDSIVGFGRGSGRIRSQNADAVTDAFTDQAAVLGVPRREDLLTVLPEFILFDGSGVSTVVAGGFRVGLTAWR